MDEEKLIILVQGHECLYNLQHTDYDNLVKDNSWKEIAGALYAQDKELSRRTQHCRRIKTPLLYSYIVLVPVGQFCLQCAVKR
jgi:hypothetical protein